MNWASLVIQMVKNLPAMQETQVQSVGQEDSLEKEMATHSSILAWRIPCESFNAKIKLFRANLRGVADKKFFLFRIAKLYAYPH